MKAIIFKPRRNAGRIKVYIPYKRKDLREKIKRMDSSYWHPEQKLWSVLNIEENMHALKNMFGKDAMVKDEKIYKPIRRRKLNKQAVDALNELEKTLTLKAYSPSTVKSYTEMFTKFLYAFQNYDLKQVTKEQIEGFIYTLIKENNITISYQNQIINAIKAYYEHVLGMPREYYRIQRPKRGTHIPNVLSPEEVYKIIQFPRNLKHRAILWTIYSAGLRISELINLRVTDIHSEDGFIFVKGSKGKKDRRTILSDNLTGLLRRYYSSYKPSYWLFEGQTGGQYSTSSIRKIFRKAVKATDSNPWATVHTLRHSFATHCLQNNVSLRHLQEMLGHNSSRTTEIYTKVSIEALREVAMGDGEELP
jgi:site-specific recombinase XerD